MFNLQNFFKKKQNSPVYLYNTLTRKKDLFEPISGSKVGMYTCGPTVYNYPHLGNMRTNIFTDILKRVLLYNNYEVNHVMNITDVGHLIGDRDMGEDKIEKESKKEGKTAWEIADFYTDAFKNDLINLNIIFPNTFCKATDNIKEQIELIQKLEKKGYTYKTSDGIYFNTSKVTDYTKLSGQQLEKLKEGARVEINDEKKNHTDFALWKFSPQNEKRQMEWPSPWGIGYPGWHIECSAMSIKYLGEQFEIHCGAVDFINLHHTNELAQSEAATGKKPWVKYWLHGGFLNLDGGRKMAKSSGDILTVKNIFIDKNINPLAYRFLTLSTHYRKPMDWSDSSVITAKSGYENLLSKIYTLENKSGLVNEEWKENFLHAINDDLNIPQALAVLFEMLKSNISNTDKLATALDFDRVLGLNFKAFINEKIEIPIEVKKLSEERGTARKEKNWVKSDQIRDKIRDMGYEVKDSSTGPVIKKI